MINKNRLLNEANSLFTQRKYKEALFKYSLLVSNFQDIKEYKIYALICDVAFEDEQKAMALFDYFTVLKEENLEEAIKYVEDVVEAFDGNIEKMMNLLKEFNDISIESLEAINYKDFKRIVEQRGSFKLAFEDIMFSTKVAIDTKDDFYDFVNKLIDNNFNTIAYSYLDGFHEYFIYDKKIAELYKKLEEKSLEINNKQ